MVCGPFAWAVASTLRLRRTICTSFTSMTCFDLSSTNLYRDVIINAYRFYASEKLNLSSLILLPEWFCFNFMVFEQPMKLSTVSFCQLRRLVYIAEGGFWYLGQIVSFEISMSLTQRQNFKARPLFVQSLIGIGASKSRPFLRCLNTEAETTLTSCVRGNVWLQWCRLATNLSVLWVTTL